MFEAIVNFFTFNVQQAVVAVVILGVFSWLSATVKILVSWGKNTYSFLKSLNHARKYGGKVEFSAGWRDILFNTFVLTMQVFVLIGAPQFIYHIVHIVFFK